MPRKGRGKMMKEESCDCENCCCGHGHWHNKWVFLGILLLVVGLMLRMGYDWSTILIVVGVLAILKGLFVKHMMM